MRRSTWFRWLVCAGIGAWLLGAVPAGADECEEKWLQCLERCTKKALRADAEEFAPWLELENDCDARCETRATKCYRKAAGDQRNQARQVLRKRQRAYAKICGRRWEKDLDRCRRAGDDLKRLQSCYRKRARPRLFDCYQDINRDLPMPGDQP